MGLEDIGRVFDVVGGSPTTISLCQMKSRCFEWVSLCHQVSQFKTAVPATWFHVVSRDSTFWTVSQRSSRRRREARVAAAVPSRRATTPRGRPRSKPSPVLREESSDRGGTTAIGAAEIPSDDELLLGIVELSDDSHCGDDGWELASQCSDVSIYVRRDR